MLLIAATYAPCAAVSIDLSLVGETSADQAPALTASAAITATFCILRSGHWFALPMYNNGSRNIEEFGWGPACTR